ncbi:alpha/beta hydrolase [Pseudonocardia sp. HH130630-07]|uniref:alpha/beta hydrolase n=1 Tax=Pseudonocardia sp. HH130630-07 TaxID=1690815 RepID=UPI001E64C684|nr:alpha/beta hydrolase [Pseudonocardia sp. HH130630-07]
MFDDRPRSGVVRPFDLVDPGFGEPVELRVLPGTRSFLDVVVARIPGWRPLTVDVHVPADGSGPFPVVVYAHGGAFIAGTPRMGPWGPLPGRGIAVVSVDYRLCGEARYPEPVEDVLTAVRWVRAHGAGYGLDPARVAGWGSSAGAFLVGRAALTDGGPIGHPVPAPAGTDATLDAVVLHYPPVDFLALLGHGPDDPRLDQWWTTTCDLFGVTRDGDLSPVRHGALPAAVARCRRVPPLLLAHGTADEVVPHVQSELLHDAVRAAGGHSELQLVDGAGHGAPVFGAPAVLDPAVRFLRRHWGDAASATDRMQ